MAGTSAAPVTDEEEKTGEARPVITVVVPNSLELPVRNVVEICKYKTLQQIRRDAKEATGSGASLLDIAEITSEFGQLEEEAATLFGQFEGFFTRYGTAVENKSKLLGQRIV